MTTRRITPAEAEEIFGTIEGTSFVGVTAITAPDVYGGKLIKSLWRKRAKATVFVGETPSYEKIVDKRARQAYVEAVGERPAATEQFRAGALWKGAGRHLRGAIVEHIPTGRKYLYAFFMRNGKVRTDYFRADSVEVGGRKVWHRSEECECPLRPKKRDAVTVTFDGVEVEAEIVIRCYALDSIRSFRIDGTNYVIDHSAPAPIQDEARAAAVVPSESEPVEMGML